MGVAEAPQYIVWAMCDVSMNARVSSAVYSASFSLCLKLLSNVRGPGMFVYMESTYGQRESELAHCIAFLQVKKYSRECNNSILKLRHCGINFHSKYDVITFAPAYLSKIRKVALESTRMTIHTTLHKAGQTKFTVYRHNILHAGGLSLLRFRISLWCHRKSDLGLLRTGLIGSASEINPSDSLPDPIRPRINFTSGFDPSLRKRSVFGISIP